jgi:hypothetical protein
MRAHQWSGVLVALSLCRARVALPEVRGAVLYLRGGRESRGSFVVGGAAGEQRKTAANVVGEPSARAELGVERLHRLWHWVGGRAERESFRILPLSSSNGAKMAPLVSEGLRETHKKCVFRIKPSQPLDKIDTGTNCNSGEIRGPCGSKTTLESDDVRVEPLPRGPPRTTRRHCLFARPGVDSRVSWCQNNVRGCCSCKAC